MAHTRLIPPTRLSEPLQHLAYDSFQRGYHHLMAALAGDDAPLEDALICLNAALVIATPATWPELWLNARAARNDALRLREKAKPM